MGKTHAPYPQEFREEAVRLVRESGKSIGRVAKDLGISDQSLRNWVKRANLNASRRTRGPSSLGLWRLTSRGVLVSLLAIVAGAAVGVVIHRAGIKERLSFRHVIEQLRDKLPSPASSRSAILPNHRSVAWKMLNEGNLREAQDGFLEILQFDPNEQDALRGLVRVRRRMAQNDPVALRRQARVYQDAGRRGVETEEHYTASSLQALAAASLQAADEIESQNNPSTSVSQDAVAEGRGALDNSVRPPERVPQSEQIIAPEQKMENATIPPKISPFAGPVTGKSTFDPKGRSPAKPTKEAPPRPRTTQASAPSSQEASPNIDDPPYTVEISSLLDSRRASGIAEELLRAGFLPTIVSSQTGPLRFRVVSETLS